MGIFRSILGIQLGQLVQYPPRPIRLSQNTPALQTQGNLSISLVTPVFNQSAFIEETLRSVLDQKYPMLEYIVMDGASTDGTWQTIEKHRSSLAHAESARDGGQADAINRGMAHAKGDILGWLNGDDLLLPGTLAYVAAFFAKNPQIDVVYGHRLLIDSSGQEIGRWIMPAHSWSALSWADFVPQETLFWRRSIFEKVGFSVDDSFNFAMDWDLLLRMREAGARCRRLPRLLGAFRVHDAQKTTAAWVTQGKPESERLLMRCHGRLPSSRERATRLLPYLIRHSVLQYADRMFNLY